MNLTGTRYGQVRDYYWVQTNNAIEYIIRAVKGEVADALILAGVAPELLVKVHARGYLESCGAEEVVNNCANLLGPDMPGTGMSKLFPGWSSGPQLDDVVMLCFSDPRNLSQWEKVIPGLHGDEVMENRYMQLHPTVAKMLFGITGMWRTGRTYEECVQAVQAGHSVGILLPGHFVSSGVVDLDTGELRIKDSWPNRKPEWNGDGFLQPLGREEFAAVQQTVIYFKP